MPLNRRASWLSGEVAILVPTGWSLRMELPRHHIPAVSGPLPGTWEIRPRSSWHVKPLAGRPSASLPLGDGPVGVKFEELVHEPFQGHGKDCPVLHFAIWTGWTNHDLLGGVAKPVTQSVPLAQRVLSYDKVMQGEPPRSRRPSKSAIAP